MVAQRTWCVHVKENNVFLAYLAISLMSASASALTRGWCRCGCTGKGGRSATRGEEMTPLCSSSSSSAPISNCKIYPFWNFERVWKSAKFLANKSAHYCHWCTVNSALLLLLVVYNLTLEIRRILKFRACMKIREMLSKKICSLLTLK